MSPPPDSRDPAAKQFRARPKGAVVVPLPEERTPRPAAPAAPYAELAAQSCFSFLRGASFPEELVEAAQLLGLEAVAVTDRNTLAGVVRAHAKAKKLGFRLVIGVRLAFSDGTPDVLAYPEDRAGYARLCRLLTHGNTKPHVVKGECDLTLSDLETWAEGLLLTVVAPEQPDDALTPVLDRLAAVAPGRVWLAVQMRRGPADLRRLLALKGLAESAGTPLLAVGDVLHHTPERKPLQDVMTCIREHVTIREAGRRLEVNAERSLKSSAEIAALFREAPEAVAETMRLLDRARFSLGELEYQYPDDDIPEGTSAQEELARRVAELLPWRYPDGAPEKVRETLAHELALIEQLDYAKYFLTVHNVVKAARDMGVLCQGRGSAANSAVCYVLGVTEVDPAVNDLLFERFISPERNEPPDIDVDFEHERREEVIRWIYERYGRDRAGIAATVITYRARSAIREVGKAFGLTDDALGALTSTIWGWSNDTTAEKDARRVGLDPQDPTLRMVLRLARELIGFPRHLSQHVGGFVITRERLDEMVPVGKGGIDGRTFVEWDKDDLDALGMLKIDVLALGMLTCIRKAFQIVEREYGERLTLASVPQEEREVYEMISRADTIGVFQIESRAQQSMLPRLRPDTFYDLVIEVAIVRPGPIQGDMVHPYLRRRQKLEPVTYPSPELQAVLEKTLGVPLFQEQAMKVAIVGAGFTPSEADRLRRAMATFRSDGTIHSFRERFLGGMAERGYDPGFAAACFRQLEGFGGYGFPESHAASFAALAYVSCWLKCRYPDAFCAALLNSQPMGFYAPAQIVRDAQEHGVEVRPVDVAFSDWDSTLEDGPDPTTRLHPRHASMKDAIWSTKAVRLG
ncbi:MAG TPA: error-prone DNA polymerase, partial [Caulobacteraceae bacterium]|nr:error-prone DNA polymerase [Caulobacteraceae bacterium]